MGDSRFDIELKKAKPYDFEPYSAVNTTIEKESGALCTIIPLKSFAP